MLWKISVVPFRERERNGGWGTHANMQRTHDIGLEYNLKQILFLCPSHSKSLFVNLSLDSSFCIRFKSTLFFASFLHNWTKPLLFTPIAQDNSLFKIIAMSLGCCSKSIIYIETWVVSMASVAVMSVHQRMVLGITENLASFMVAGRTCWLRDH
ncbi:hypothetical protein E2542_SST18488 [Spatholobus suberectus]|nr:hypothetical protein E2542_SST18488 [Spatholobus suberectus]